MSRRLLGMMLVASGAVLMLVGALMIGGSGDTSPTTTTVQAAAPTTTAVASPTTVTTITTTTAVATTTTIGAETLDHFEVSYRAALDSDDVKFLFDRLHPLVIEVNGAELCRAWVTREVVALDNYQISGEVTGPADQTFTASDGSKFAIADTFSTTITFTFQGQDFETEAGFALVDGVMHWLGTCE